MSMLTITFGKVQDQARTLLVRSDSLVKVSDAVVSGTQT